jgi:hypothetical protein
MSPTSATISPIQKLQKIQIRIPAITRIPPSEIPPSLRSATASSLVVRPDLPLRAAIQTLQRVRFNHRARGHLRRVIAAALAWMVSVVALSAIALVVFLFLAGELTAV